MSQDDKPGIIRQTSIRVSKLFHPCREQGIGAPRTFSALVGLIAGMPGALLLIIGVMYLQAGLIDGVLLHKLLTRKFLEQIMLQKVVSGLVICGLIVGLPAVIRQVVTLKFWNWDPEVKDYAALPFRYIVPFLIIYQLLYWFSYLIGLM